MEAGVFPTKKRYTKRRRKPSSKRMRNGQDSTSRLLLDSSDTDKDLEMYARYSKGSGKRCGCCASSDVIMTIMLAFALIVILALSILFAYQGQTIKHMKNTRENSVPTILALDLALKASKGSGKRCGCCASSDVIMTIMLAFALIVILALSILFAYQGQTIKHMKETCQTAECVQVSASILSRMDLSAKPCEDFYTYACGGFVTDPMIPPDEAKHSQFAVIDRRVNAIIKRTLENTTSFEYRGHNSTAIEKLKVLYHVCMNQTAADNTGREPLLRLIGSIGGWTVTNDSLAGGWSEHDFDLTESVALLHNLSITALFDMGVSRDNENSSVNILKFDQPGLSLDDITRYLGNKTEKYKNAFVDYFSALAELLGAPPGDETRQLGKDIWDFEVEIAKISDKQDDRVDIRQIYHKMTIQNLQQLLFAKDETVNLAQYLHLLFNKNLSADTVIIVYSPNYYGSLSALINKTPKKTIANYLAFNLVQSFVSYLGSDFHKPAENLRAVLSGVTVNQADWLICSKHVFDHLAFALGALYTEDYFYEEDKQYINKLLDQIMATFDENLDSVSWMDDVTRTGARVKLRAVKGQIGYPDFIKDPVMLDEYYQNLTVRNTTPFENAIYTHQFSAQKDFLELFQAPDPDKWSMGPTEVNAYYSPSSNQMVFPAGILGPPFYSSDFPAAMNFGSMGFIMGHELTHGFDNRGRLYDKYGNLHTWWTNSSDAKFEERKDCLVQQANHFPIQDTFLDGLTTLGESIADNGGLKTSYAAYQKYLKSHNFKDENSNLPGLSLTKNKLFFLAYAQTWCTFITPEYERQIVVTDAHPNPKYRVNGVLEDNPDFAEAYGCPQGSKMNPREKCSVW